MTSVNNRRHFAFFLGALISMSGALVDCAATPDESNQSTQQSLSLGRRRPACAVAPDPAKSLFVTDPIVLAQFSFERVMDQIAATGSNTGQTGLALYQQLFDTLNDQAHAVTSGPHCDDVLTNGVPSLNGFPIECPRQEGVLASTNPFTPGDPDSFVPLGVVNRFDLAPADGTNCGEYRIVFGKISAQQTFKNRTLIIFEAKLPNVFPDAGLLGCLPVVEFWNHLTEVTDSNVLASQLAKFYFDGIRSRFGAFPPVVLAQNYGIGRGPDTGQIRTNMFMNVVSGQVWELREFRLDQTCDDYGTCTVLAENTFVQNNPFGGLFAGSDDQSSQFQQEFLAQVPTLASASIPTIAMTTPLAFNGGESHEQGSDNDYTARAASSATFLAAIDGQLAAIGRTDLTAKNILDRATTQSCAGCHQVATKRDLGGGLTWPASNFFTQVDEKSNLSPALKDVFLPFRAQVMTSFLNSQLGCTSGGDGGSEGGAGDDGGNDASYPPGTVTTVSGTLPGAAN